MNQVILMGHLGADPELRYTNGQKAVTTFNVATSERRGEEQVTTWHRVVCWEKQAEAVCRSLRKGSKALLQGKITNRQYEDKEGVKRSITEIVAYTVTFLDPRPAAASGGNAQRSAPDTGAPANPSLDNIPF